MLWCFEKTITGMSRDTVIAALALAALLSSASYAQDGSATCVTCHAVEAAQLAKSTHAALGCQECHGGADAYAVAPADLASFAKRGAGAGSEVAFDHGASFLGKPSRFEIPERCGSCHADVVRMNPYGLPTDQLARYLTSGHGKTLAQGKDARVAVCVDCHGVHDILPGREPASRTHPLNVPDTCSRCHADEALMGDYDLSVAVVDEYRRSVHGRLLFEQQDTGAPTCATCHGNHAAIPPGFSSVGAVCGRCHLHATANFATSVHAEQEEHKGCVQCHGGGEGRHFHLIERITKPTGLLLQRYAHLLAADPNATPEQITEAIHPDPKAIITRALPTCMDCHDDFEDDESLPKLFELLDEIAAAERTYVRLAKRLDEVEQGVLLVDSQRFKFEEARTHLVELAPLQHTLDNDKVAAKVAELSEVCREVNAELDELERGLAMRRKLLLPIWLFAAVFAVALYAKFKQLKAIYVRR